MGIYIPDSVIAVGWADLGVYKTTVSTSNLGLSYFYKAIIIISFTSAKAAISSIFVYLCGSFS